MSKILDKLLKHYMNEDVAVLHYDKTTKKSEVVAYVSVNKNLPLAKKLEEAFVKTNSIHIAWWKNEEVETVFVGKSCRSTSVGDMVILDEKTYRCEDNGWKTLDGEIVK
jgi:hypothetical protein